MKPIIYPLTRYYTQYIFANLFTGKAVVLPTFVIIVDVIYRCGCREFPLCIPDDRRLQGDHSRGDASLQEGVGRVC